MKPRGKRAWEKYQNEGKRLGRRDAIEANCYDCMGEYADGRYDCEISNCPLYNFMPYRGRKEANGHKLSQNVNSLAKIECEIA